MKNFILLVPLIFLISCQIASHRGSESNVNAPLVDPKYSIAKDREELDAIRESVPQEIKSRNDEKALMAELMGELKYDPSVVREKFANLVRKKRELFNKDMNRSREEFSKREKKERDEFFKELESDRESFLKRKVDREKRADFFNDQDEARRTFIAEQREKRDEYEADTRDKRKNFEDYVKEKNDEFNAELKEYTVRWKEKEKLEREKQELENSQN
ncbi:hypothetical protein K2P97_04410 [bacterium]|nr:hypothetical protein [bacterium]